MGQHQPRILVTGASGQLGSLVIDHLLKNTSAEQIAAIVRTRSKADGLLARGISVFEADYTKPKTLDSAFVGVDRLLLISSNELGGGRFPHHRNVIEAAKRAGVKLLAYTSLLHADVSPLGLHREQHCIYSGSAGPWGFAWQRRRRPNIGGRA